MAKISEEEVARIAREIAIRREEQYLEGSPYYTKKISDNKNVVSLANYSDKKDDISLANYSDKKDDISLANYSDKKSNIADANPNVVFKVIHQKLSRDIGHYISDGYLDLLEVTRGLVQRWTIQEQIEYMLKLSRKIEDIMYKLYPSRGMRGNMGLCCEKGKMYSALTGKPTEESTDASFPFCSECSSI